MSNIIPFDYEGQPIRFNTEGWINATEAAKHFGKRVQHWLDNEQTQEYIRETLDELAEQDPARFKSRNSGLLVVAQRGRNGGTWLHPELAVEFARWLSPKFARWCDRNIKELIRQGLDTQGYEHIVGLLLRPEASEWERRFPPDYYQALARVTRTEYRGHQGGTPAVFGRLTRQWVYGVIMPREVLAELDARRTDSEKLHQWLTDGGAKVLDAQVAKVTTIANTSTDLRDFEGRCQRAFGVPGQMHLVYPAAA